MSEAWNVFIEAWRETKHNIGAMIKISLTTMIILLVIGGFVGFNFIGKMIELDTAAVPGETPSGIGASILLFIIYGIFFMFAVCGLCVNSYRYLLNQTYQPSWVPFQFDWSATLGFFGRSILLMLIVSLVLLIPILIIGMIVSSTINSGAFSGGMIVFIVLLYILALLLAYWVSYRFYMSLIANSIGQKMGFGEAWSATKPQSGMFFALMCIVLGVSFGAAILSNVLPLLFVNMGGIGVFLIFVITIIYLIFSLYLIIVSIVLGAVLFKRYYYTGENVFS